MVFNNRKLQNNFVVRDIGKIFLRKINLQHNCSANYSIYNINCKDIQNIDRKKSY